MNGIVERYRHKQRQPFETEGTRLNLGAGNVREEGWITFDIVPTFSPDVMGDARRLPFRGGSFTAIKAHHVLEHIRREDLIAVMNELWRVLGDEGQVWIEVPLFPTEDAIADPTHVSFFVSRTFDYFEQGGEFEDHRRMYGIRPWKIITRERLNYGRTLDVVLEKAQ